MSIVINAAFDSGNIRVVAVQGDVIDLEIVADHLSDFYQWFHFRVAGARGRTLTFRIVNAGGSAYAFGWPGYRARMSGDRMQWRQVDTGYADGVHQGVALKVPPYTYAHPQDLLEQIIDRGEVPLLVALDGVTDPRNLGAIIRSTGAFGGQGLILPQRRSASVNSAAWKTSAGAAARIPVALAANLTATLKEFKKQGVFVLGLAGDGDVSLPALELADRPVVIVVGSEGKGLSRLVTETCDQVVSIPISTATESLNAGIAASVALYQVSTLRAAH